MANFNGVLLTLIISWQATFSANTIAQSLAENSNNQPKEVPMSETVLAVKKTLVIQLEIVELTDNSGLTYIGGKVNAADLELYLSRMKKYSVMTLAVIDNIKAKEIIRLST